MTTDVDEYFIVGCGRCPLSNTPQCKVNNWQKELALLRAIVKECGLTEEAKWGVPVYTFQGKNIVIVSAFKEFCSISFFKGSLLADTHHILTKSGENSQAGRNIVFTSVEPILEAKNTLKAYIFEAIEIEKLGLKVNYPKPSEIDIPAELNDKFIDDPIFYNAFYALTPGRQKGYILYFSAPKQSKTRLVRIENMKAKILSGKGVHDY